MDEQGDRRLIILIVFAVVAIGVVAAILIGRSGGGASPATTASASGCRQVETPKPKHISLKAPKQTVKPTENLSAQVITSCGTFDVALSTREAPKIVNSFVYLADRGFYNDLTFHRIAPGFVIQGGDPLGNGTGGPGYSVVEKPPAKIAYTKGTVAMAKSAAAPAGSAGSQFFVVTAPKAAPLPPEYALLGAVSKGYDVVARIGSLGTPAQKPTQTILIEKITIKRG